MVPVDEAGPAFRYSTRSLTMAPGATDAARPDTVVVTSAMSGSIIAMEMLAWSGAVLTPWLVAVRMLLLITLRATPYCV